MFDSNVKYMNSLLRMRFDKAQSALVAMEFIWRRLALSISDGVALVDARFYCRTVGVMYGMICDFGSWKLNRK
jgi:hypothetical protein